MPRNFGLLRRGRHERPHGWSNGNKVRRSCEGRRRPVRLTPSHRLYVLGAVLLVALTICARNFSGQGEAFPLIPLLVAGVAYLLAIREFFCTSSFPKRVIVVGLVIGRAVAHCISIDTDGLGRRRSPICLGWPHAAASAITLTLWYPTIQRLPRCTQPRRERSTIRTCPPHIRRALSYSFAPSQRFTSPLVRCE